jgi:hypothetical protein
MSTETEGEGGELIGELVEELGGRPWWQHRRRSHGYGGEATIQKATATAEQHCAHGRTAKHNTTPGGDAGVAGMPSNRLWRRRPAADVEKKSRGPNKPS